jgi:membrane-associated protease RseP (regulator of RpoE activity)
LLAAILIAALALGVLAAPATLAADDGKKDLVATLEAKVKALEERIKQLEAAAEKKAGAAAKDLWGDWRQKRGFNRDMTDLLDRLQREMQRDFSFGWGAPGQMLRAKPRLGVELGEVNADLKERFKNDVKEGAFVMSVAPDSPAEKAGIQVGDAITSFAGKSIAAPRDLVDAVKGAPEGKHEVVVTRRGEAVKLQVSLTETPADQPLGLRERDGWLRRGDKPGKGGVMESRTEVKASALELTDKLAQDLKLTDEQRKKMSEVLAKENQALNEEVAAQHEKGAARRGYRYDMSSDVGKLVEKHVAAAEKELTGTLNKDQIAQWAEHRKTHSEISVQYSMKRESGPEMSGDKGGATNF